MWTFFLATSSTQLFLATEREPKAGPQTASGPLWQVDLRPLGYNGFTPKGELWGEHFKINSVCFSGDSSLIVTFLTREVVATLSRRDKSSDQVPLRLHAVFIDADKGAVKTASEWPSSEPRGGILPARGGRFIVVTPERLLLYSPSLELLKDFKLRTEDNPPFELAGVYSSPAGGSILLQYNDYHKYWFQWMDPDILQPLRSWEEVLAWITISDTKLAFSHETYTKPTGFLYEVLIRGIDGASQTVCRSVNGDDDCGISPQFISNELLALSTFRGLRLIRSDGTMALVTKFKANEELWRTLSPSANGNRFAVQQFVNKGGSALLDISSHGVFHRIVVFDVPTSQWIYNLEAKSQSITTFPNFALSPDGSKLAVLADGVVEVYQLPSAVSHGGIPH